jgi:tungstate transport system ATP-binding protein
MLDRVRAQGAVEPSSDLDRPPPLAETRDLVLEIGGKRLVDGIDLRLSRGTITFVIGPNGAGKSLLLRLLHGMIRPTSGAILWEGRPLDEDMRRRQAMVFQKPVLLRRSVAANIEFVLKLRGRNSPRRCEELLEHVGLLAHARQPARLLSGGEQQRLALARALALEPRVLFLDEPTASLDPASTLAIETNMSRAHAGGMKIVCITHDIGQTRRLAQDVVFLHRGRVLEHRPAKAFFSKPSSGPARDYLAGKIVL